jgi:hypothetical protein
MNQVGSCVVQLRLVASLLVTYRLLVCVLRWMETAKERSSGALAGSTYFGVQYQCAPIQHPPVYVHRERETATGVGTVRPPLLLHRDMRYNCMHGCIYHVESWSSPPSHHFNKLCMSSCCFFPPSCGWYTTVQPSDSKFFSLESDSRIIDQVKYEGAQYISKVIYSGRTDEYTWCTPFILKLLTCSLRFDHLSFFKINLVFYYD